MGIFSNNSNNSESAFERKYREDVARYNAAQADRAYQQDLKKFYNLYKKVNERYSILNTVGSFLGSDGEELIRLCKSMFKIEAKIHDKRTIYENCQFLESVSCKKLALIYEKRKEYNKAVDICVQAINAGFPEDGTKGNMRGRIARLIKKGSLPLTDELKCVLGLSSDSSNIKNKKAENIELVFPEYIDSTRIRCPKCGVTMQKRKNCWKCGAVFAVSK